MRDPLTQAPWTWSGQDRARARNSNRNAMRVQDSPPDGSPSASKQLPLPQQRLDRVLAAIKRESASDRKQEQAMVDGLDIGLTLAFGPDAMVKAGRSPRLLSQHLDGDLLHRLRDALSHLEREFDEAQGRNMLRGLIVGLLLARPLGEVARLTRQAASGSSRVGAVVQKIIANL